MREEKGLGGNFKGVTKFTQYSTASRDTSLREEIGLGGKLRGVTKFTQYSTASGDTSLREEIGLGWKFKGVTKFTQYCQRRHKFERIDRPRKDALEVSQNSHSTVLQWRHRLLCSSWAINSGKGGLGRMF